MTPTNPIIEAREALAKLAHDEYVKSEDRRIVAAALDLAETQAAEIERLKKDHYVRFTDTMNKLELDNAMMAQRLKAGELEYMRSKEAEITTLKAKLAKAEEVIKPFAEAAESLTGSEDDDAIIAPAFMDSPPLGECDLVVCCVADLRAAAQFTKEREGL